MNSYTVKEIFYTLQGEGINSGRPSVFVRFSGCNLWSGVEKDRVNAVCNFCDTQFVGGEKLSLDILSTRIKNEWNVPNRPKERKLIVFTGGEPLLQLNQELINSLPYDEYELAVETNGTKKLTLQGLDWVCVSPKTKKLEITKGEELKFVYPQIELHPKDFEMLNFKNWVISPMDDLNINNNTKQATQFCLNNPKWRLSLQTHKLLGLR